MVQALFGESVPDECPEDSIDKQRYLAAQAVARLLLDNAMAGWDDDDATTDTTAATQPRPRPGNPEFIAVIDAAA